MYGGIYVLAKYLMNKSQKCLLLNQFKETEVKFDMIIAENNLWTDLVMNYEMKR